MKVVDVIILPESYDVSLWLILSITLTALHLALLALANRKKRNNKPPPRPAAPR